MLSQATLLVKKQRELDANIQKPPTEEEQSGALTLIDHAERAAHVKHWELALSCYKNAARLWPTNYTITVSLQLQLRTVH